MALEEMSVFTQYCRKQIRQCGPEGTGWGSREKWGAVPAPAVMSLQTVSTNPRAQPCTCQGEVTFGSVGVSTAHSGI